MWEQRGREDKELVTVADFRDLCFKLQIHFEDDEINQFFSIIRNHIPPGTWWSASLEPCTAASSSDTCPRVSQE